LPHSFEEGTSTSNGKGATLFVGTNAGGSRRRSLLRFPIASVAPLPGQQIVNATLRITVESPVGGCAAIFPVCDRNLQFPSGSTTLFLHRLSATPVWFEGNSIAVNNVGAAADSNDATCVMSCPLHSLIDVQVDSGPLP
jgi:hypothetical protein